MRTDRGVDRGGNGADSVNGTSQIARDLALKLDTRLGEVLHQELKLAQQVLEPAEISIVLLNGAQMVARSVCATIGSLAPVEGQGDLYDLTLKLLIEQIGRGREKAVALMATQAGAQA